MRDKMFHHLPGLALCAALTVAATLLADSTMLRGAGLSALTLAILAGMLFGNTVFGRMARACGAGVQFAKGPLLRLGIILYGFRLSFQDIAAVGVAGVLTDALVLGSTFLIAYQLGTRLLRLDRHSAILIGAGSSICGAAAVLATEPVIGAKSDKVTVAVATVVIFGTVAMFLYPLLFRLNAAGGWLADGHGFGIFTGATIHEVAQVVAAGREMGEAAANAAVITKMIRVMMLAPFLILLSVWLKRAEPGTARRRIAIPWFALLFVAVTGFNSLHLLSTRVVAALQVFDGFLLAMAMGALGLHTHIAAIRQAGAKPLLLGALLFVWLLAGGALISRVVQVAL